MNIAESEQAAAEAHVSLAYHVLLRRAPDPSGMESSVKSLLNGESDPTKLMERLLRSNEFAINLPNFIAHYVKADKIPPANP